MSIQGLENMSGEALVYELERGGRFVVYEYCISILIMTFRRSSPIRFVRAGEATVGPGLGFSLVSLTLGWWGIPWGPIWTIGSLISNFRGGKDVTAEVLTALNEMVESQ